MPPFKQHGRRYDLVVLGATGNTPPPPLLFLCFARDRNAKRISGYTGQLTVDHIAEHLPIDLRWGIAGRSQAKLDALLDETQWTPGRSLPCMSWFPKTCGKADEYADAIYEQLSR